MAQVAAAAANGGAIVLHGRADEDLSGPFQPWVQALRHYVSHADRAALRAELGDAAPDLVRLLPELARMFPDLPRSAPTDPESERLRLFDAIELVLTAASRTAPVLVALDDLHWADRPSLVLLRRLARSEQPGAVLLLGTYRETDLVRTHPLAEALADLRREPRVERVLLRGLGADEVGALVAARGQQEPPPAFVLALHAETDGNPFFVEEVLRHLVETGALRHEGGRWTSDRPLAELGIPEGVREVVGRRLSRLSEAANQALGVAAAVGRDFDVPTLEAAGGPTGDALLDALDEALRARLIVEIAGAAGRFAFAHALVRQTLYEELGTTRRVRLHWRIGEALEHRFAHSLDEHAGAIAHHLCEGALAGDAGRAAEASLRAARLAQGLAAHEETVAHCNRALALLDQTGREDPELRYALLMALGRALLAIGEEHRPAFFQAREIAKSEGWPARAAQAVIAATTLFTSTQAVRVENQGLIRDALGLLPAGDSAERCQLLCRLSTNALGLGDATEAADLSERALAMARRLGRADELVVALNSRVVNLAGSPHVAELERVGAEMLGSVGGLADVRLEAVGRRAVIHAAVLRGDRPVCLAALDAMVQVTQRQRLATFQTQQWTAALELAAGRFQEARTASATYRDLGSGVADSGGALSFQAVVTAARLEQGRHGQVLPGLEPFVAGATPMLLAYRAVLASTRAALGQDDAARAELRGLAEGGFRSLVRDAGWPLALRHLAEACAVLGEVDVARDLEPELLPYSGLLLVAFFGALVEGAADRAIGQVLAVQGRLDEACERYERALALEEGFGADALAARTRWWWARALAERGGAGDVARAGALASESLATARALGMNHLAGQARELATRLGASGDETG
jgi:tetratricopeptide (TPR) repeat protein